MAASDRKSSSSSGGYGRISYGRSETQAEHDARMRAASKAVLDHIAGQANPCQYLLKSHSDYLVDVYQTTHKITTRNRYDWDRIMDLLSQDCQAKVQEALEKAREDRLKVQEKQSQEREAKWQHQQMIYAEEAKARAQEEYNQKMETVQQAQLVLGSIQSETSQVFQHRERYELDQGDYLEDPVSTRLRSGGWMEDSSRRAGFKLQITVSLDVSNSVWYNRIAAPAIKAFQELTLAVRALKEENPDDVRYSAWLFSQDKDGKGVEQLTDFEYKWIGDGKRAKKEVDDPLKETRKLWNQTSIPYYAGEDSWLSPLLEKIANWESKQADDGYVKLDIILSDGVFERKVDITRSDDIQAGRGQAHTVILNFMQEEDWFNGRLPYQVVQYPVTADNVGGILRLVLAQFLEAYI